jgi:hypothetical protein
MGDGGLLGIRGMMRFPLLLGRGRRLSGGMLGKLQLGIFAC